MAKRDRTKDAAPAGAGDLSGGMRARAGLSRRRDPGDAVPEGVAPEAPAPLTEEDRKVLRQLEDLPKRSPGGR